MAEPILYRDFEISWQEPPMFSGEWSCNVASNNATLHAAMVLHKPGDQGAAVIKGRTREEMLANARQFIDQVIGG